MAKRKKDEKKDPAKPKPKRPAAKKSAASPGPGWSFSGNLDDPAFLASLPPELNQAFREMGKKFGFGLPSEPPASDPKARALQLADEAESSPPPKAHRLIDEALRLDPNCADALLARASLEPDGAKRLELLRQAVAAAERALGPAKLSEHVGEFYRVMETRPYMRARHELAIECWHAGLREEAVAHAYEMLRLNPNDNQGMREALVPWLLALGRDAELKENLDRYDESTALCRFSQALVRFRLGDAQGAELALKKASRTNKHMANLLLGDAPMPREEPDSYTLGSKDEAVLAALQLRPAWNATPGALSWLRERTPAPRKRGRKSLGPTEAALKELALLPQEPVVWQADFRIAADWVEDSRGKRVRMSTAFVLNLDDQLLIALGTYPDEPSSEQLFDLLAKAMRAPEAGEPHRPAKVEVAPKEAWSLLRPSLERLGVGLRTVEALEPLSSIMAAAEEEILGPPQPSLLEVPGMTEERLGAFYAAAARFHRAAPWRHVSQEGAIRFDIPALGKPWFGVVMGQGGQEFGLALYSKLDSIRDVWDRPDDPEAGFQAGDVMSLLFGGPGNLSAREVDAAAEHGWPLAEAGLYPFVIRAKAGLEFTEPVEKELRFLAAAMEAVPAFVQARATSEREPFSARVRELEGETEATLSWAAVR